MEYLAWLTEFGHGGPPDVPLARAWYERAADAGNVASLYALGDILFYGAEGVAVDIPRAMEFFERGHAAGSIDSIYMLGVLYREGGLLPVDLVYARHLLMQAVQMDVQRAFNELCIMMIDGRGGPVDWSRAEALFRGGYRRGSPGAAINLARLFEQHRVSGL